MNRTLNSDDPAAYVIPDDQDLVSQEMFLYEISGGSDLYNYVSEDFKAGYLHIELNGYDGEEIVQNMDAAYDRVRGYAAPANAQRFDIDTPCKKIGECADCLSGSTICAQFVQTRICKPAGRIKVVLIGEELGI